MKRLSVHLRMAGVLASVAAAVVALAPRASGQVQNRWLAAGSMHNWYSAIGYEIEEGDVKEQQWGLRWPAYYQFQDMQAAKGFWIGAANWTDAGGTNYPQKVVHVGPRVTGIGEFFPVSFETVSRFDPPTVTVDGIPSLPSTSLNNTRVDATMKADRMLVNVVNTAVGITMTRKVMQFSQEYHDNYHVTEYTFTNTGNINADPAIELPAQTVTGVYFFFQHRYAPCKGTRYVVGNSSGWGINTMNDSRGDGVKPDPPGQNVRAFYAWHGKAPFFTIYDNIGAPIWTPPSVSNYGDPADTIGRLGAPQFVGTVTLHADRSAIDHSDDPAQPSTTTYVGSDDVLTSNNDQFNKARMALEYGWMTTGHISPRHADRVQPDGNFSVQTGDPSLGTSGGYSAAAGYGPYTLAPGQSVTIVVAEGAAGLSHDRSVAVGRKFKAGQIGPVAKNDSVFTGRDSLFQTFQRAIANYTSGYALPQPPLPPKFMNVVSGGDKVILNWELYTVTDPNLKGFEVYRSKGRYDGDYEKIASLTPTARGFNDETAVRGEAYFYYVVSVGDPALNAGGGGTPAGVALRSNRIFAQSYDPAFLLRQAGASMNDIRIVPNPFSIASSLGFSNARDKIAFFNIPGYCKIRIYTELGELISEIDHSNGSGDEYWNSITSSNQVIVSGIYIVVFENTRTGERAIRKLSVIR
jgi:hypothetical protein